MPSDPPEPPPRVLSRVGYRLAQTGAVLHVLGGLSDQANRTLLPFHEAYLGYAHGEVPEPVATLVLALLHALGFALIGLGLGMLALLARLRQSGDRRLALVIVAMAALGEGSVGLHMIGLGFAFGWIPLGAAALVVTGVVAHTAAR